MNLTDSELARVAATDPGAFAVLCQRHRPAMHRAAAAILRSEADAEDAVQSALLKCHRALPGFRGEAAIGTWMYACARNEALMLLRANKRSRSNRELTEADHPVVRTGPQIEAKLTLEAALRRMTPQQREMVRAYYENGLKFDAAAYAQGHGLLPGAAKSRWLRALRQIRQMRAPEFATQGASRG